eukprot:gene10078-12355_t
MESNPFSFIEGEFLNNNNYPFANNGGGSNNNSFAGGVGNESHSSASNNSSFASRDDSFIRSITEELVPAKPIEVSNDVIRQSFGGQINPDVINTNTNNLVRYDSVQNNNNYNPIVPQLNTNNNNINNNNNNNIPLNSQQLQQIQLQLQQLQQQQQQLQQLQSSLSNNNNNNNNNYTNVNDYPSSPTYNVVPQLSPVTITTPSTPASLLPQLSKNYANNNNNSNQNNNLPLQQVPVLNQPNQQPQYSNNYQLPPNKNPNLPTTSTSTTSTSTSTFKAVANNAAINNSPSSPPSTVNTNENGQQILEILDDEIEFPFPKTSTQNHALVPSPAVRVSNIELEPGDFLICLVDPKEGFEIQNFSVSNNNSRVFIFNNLQISRKKNASNYRSFKLHFSLNRYGPDYTIRSLAKVISPVINFFNHTSDLPNPDIVRLCPNNVNFGENYPYIAAYSNYFKFGTSLKLSIDVYANDGSQVSSIPQGSLRKKKEQAFKVEFVAPSVPYPGEYSVYARYSKSSGSSGSTENQEGQILFYNDPNNNNPFRQFGEITNNPTGGDSQYYSPSDVQQMGGFSGGSTPSTSQQSSPVITYQSKFASMYEKAANSNMFLPQNDRALINKIRDLHGNTIIMISIFKQDFETFSKVINFKPDLTLTNKNGHNAFHIACALGHYDFVSVLTGRMDPLIKDNRGATGLHLAVEHNKENIYSYLLDYNPELAMAQDNNGLTPFHYAVMDGDIRCSNRFIDCIVRNKQSSSASSRFSLDVPDNHLMTPLHWSCALEQPDITEALIKAGADSYAKDELDNYPIHKSFINEDYETIEVFRSEKFNMELVKELDMGPRKKLPTTSSSRSSSSSSSDSSLSYTISTSSTSGRKRQSDIEQGILDFLHTYAPSRTSSSIQSSSSSSSSSSSVSPFAAISLTKNEIDDEIKLISENISALSLASEQLLKEKEVLQKRLKDSKPISQK